MGDGLAGMGANLFTTGVTALANNDLMEQDRGQREQFSWEQLSANQIYNDQQAQANRAFQQKQVDDARTYNTWASTTQYQRAVDDMKTAGLNPMLAYHMGGNAAPTSPTASGSQASSSGGGGPSGGTSPTPASNMYTAGAEAALLTASADKTRAETAEIEARTPTHAKSREQIDQMIEQSKEEIKKIQQEVATGAASAELMAQQNKNLQAAIPQIKATVENLKAQTGEIAQRVQANLPKLEAAVKNLERLAREMDIPGRQMSESVKGSFVGALGAVIRELTGLGAHTSIAK